MTIEKKVIDLLELGYDNDIITKTLGITYFELDYIKKQIESNKSRKKPYPNQKTKLQLLREKYEQIYNSGVETLESNGKTIKPLSEEQLEEVTKRLEKVESILQKISSLSIPKQKEAFREILKIYSYMDKLDLPIELAEKAYTFLSDSNVLRIANKYTNIDITPRINRYKIKYINAIGEEINNTDDMDGLRKLSGLLRSLASRSQLMVLPLQNKINKKVQKLRSEQTTCSLRISNENIEEIIILLMSPNFDENSLNKLLEKFGLEYLEKRKDFIEAAKRNRPFAGFQVMTLEEAKKQVISQVVIELESKKIEIDNIDEFYQRLLKIGIINSVAVYMIVGNLLKEARFNDAEEFVTKVYGKSEERDNVNSLRSSRMRIRNAQICDFIMKGINPTNGSIRDEDQYYEMIQSGIKKANINPNVLVLGTTRDGLKKITWADLTEKEKKRNYTGR